MKRLKVILQCKFIYFFLLFIALILYFVSSSLNYVSVYDSFNNEEFVITNITFKDYGVRFDLKGKEKVIGYVYCKDDEFSLYDDFVLGDRVLITGNLSSINNNTVPNTFNYKKYLISNEIYNVIEITDIKKVNANISLFYKIKNKLYERGKMLDKSYPYINSLIFGNNSYLDEDVLASYRENGISHLFAISGLHISIFIMIISYVLDRMKIPLFFKSLILILFLLFYMFLTNFSMSVLRGAIFTILILINKLLKLDILIFNLLLLTLCIILFMNPLNINNVGLLYSFLVTLFLVVFSHIINGKSKVYSLFMISFIAFLVSYPITINNFNQVNFLSVIYNVFFVPYVSSILLPFTLVSFVFPFLDDVLFFFVKIIEISSQFLNSISILKVSMCKMNVLMICVYFVIICKLFLSWNEKKCRYLICLFIFFGIHFFFPFLKNDYVMYFDVGQGDSSIVRIDGVVSLIDTGGILSYGDGEYNYKISKNKLIPYLKSNGIRKIDNLILTHGDFDHMGEAIYFVSNFKVDKVVFNCGVSNKLEKDLIYVLKEKNISYDSCVGELDVGKYKFKFLNTGIYDNENDSSSVIYFKYNEYKFLFMADAGKDRENDIINKYKIRNIDFLKIGHHGSNTSSDSNFIKVINPKYSIISVGANNRFGHPREEVLDILDKRKIYRTDMDGSIEIKLSKNGYKIKTFKP